MKTVLLAIGKTDDEYLTEGIRKYVERIRHYAPFEFKCLPDIKNSRSLTRDQQKQQEGRLLTAEMMPGDVVALLDEGGRQYSSRQFSQFYSKIAASGAKRLVFVIGGPYGFSDDVYKAATHKISLSPMTFSHQMVRLIFVEQLYRLHTIIKGEPYHHD